MPGVGGAPLTLAIAHQPNLPGKGGLVRESVVGSLGSTQRALTPSSPSRGGGGRWHSIQGGGKLAKLRCTCKSEYVMNSSAVANRQATLVLVPVSYGRICLIFRVAVCSWSPSSDKGVKPEPDPRDACLGVAIRSAEGVGMWATGTPTLSSRCKKGRFSPAGAVGACKELDRGPLWQVAGPPRCPPGHGDSPGLGGGWVLGLARGVCAVPSIAQARQGVE
jgi:hypothetical protein